MPEVIEVKLYKDFIQKKFNNKKLKSIEIINGRYKKHGPPDGLKEFDDSLPSKLTFVGSKGKFMYMSFESGQYLGITLGLTGGWFYSSSKSKKLVHCLDSTRYQIMDDDVYMKNALAHINVKFKFESGTLYFYDQLSYGTITVFPNEQTLNVKLKTLGLDIMDMKTTLDMFTNQITKKTNMEKPIGNVIVNQKLISGIGNYLRADCLWLSKISPFRKVKDLTKTEIARIYRNVRKLTWSEYNYDKGIELGIIKKSDKFPFDYDRDFFIYTKETDINNKPVTKEKLYEGSQIRYVYWVKSVQK